MGRLATLLLVLLASTSPSHAQRRQLWTNRPVNLLADRGPMPVPPFRFLSEEKGGTSPKVMVRDARGARWQVKFGPEVKAETFASRFIWALGYHTDVTHFIRNGRILGAHKLSRAGEFIDKGGRFKDARFEYRDPSLKFLKKPEWSWEENPFTGTQPFNGLKILVMLLSNWDNKDGSDRVSNTGIVQRGSGSDRTWTYYVTDWGGSMGKWGRTFFHSKWECDDFAGQTPDFIKEVTGGEVDFGFTTGNHGGDFKDDITIRDVRWLLRGLNEITDAQIRTALRQSGASAHESEHFTRALRARIRQLQVAARLGDPSRNARVRFRKT